jgi:hypothetical protein
MCTIAYIVHTAWYDRTQEKMVIEVESTYTLINDNSKIMFTYFYYTINSLFYVFEILLTYAVLAT